MLGNLLVALVLISGEFDVQASAIVESRVGEAPIIGGQQPEAFVTEIVTPVGLFEYRDPGVTFQADYSPRIYWQHPNALGHWSPLVLHTANLVLSAKSTRRLTLVGAATGSIGNPDYIQLTQLLNTTQIPQVVEIASVTGHLGAQIALARRWELDLDGLVFYWRSLGIVNDPTTFPTVTDQKSATEKAFALYQLTPRNSLGFGASLSEASYNGGSLDIYTLGPALAWKVHLTPRDDLRVTLGLTYVRAAGMSIGSTMPLLGSSGQAASPVGAFDLVSQVARRDEYYILANASAGVDYYVDPVLATAVPRARAAAGLMAMMAPLWSAILRADFSTALRSTAFPLPSFPTSTPTTPAPVTYPDETLASLSVAVRRRVSPGMFAEIGGLWADRAPAFVTPGFEFHQRQLWLFAQLAWTSHPTLQTVPQLIQ